MTAEILIQIEGEEGNVDESIRIEEDEGYMSRISHLCSAERSLSQIGRGEGRIKW